MHRLTESLAEAKHELLGDTSRYLEVYKQDDRPHDNLVD